MVTSATPHPTAKWVCEACIWKKMHFGGKMKEKKWNHPFCEQGCATQEKLTSQWVLFHLIQYMLYFIHAQTHGHERILLGTLKVCIRKQPPPLSLTQSGQPSESSSNVCFTHASHKWGQNRWTIPRKNKCVFLCMLSWKYFCIKQQKIL